MSDNKIPFSYDKYLSGGYRVVTRDGREPEFKLKEKSRSYWLLDDGTIYPVLDKNGKVWNDKKESPLDLFLIPISKEGEEDDKRKKIRESLPIDTSYDVKHSVTEKEILKAYVLIRQTNNTIPDEVLDFMKQSSIEKLKEGVAIDYYQANAHTTDVAKIKLAPKEGDKGEKKWTDQDLLKAMRFASSHLSSEKKIQEYLTSITNGK